MSREYGEREVTTIEKRCIGTSCDTCGKEISMPEQPENYGWHYYHVMTSHSDWGNDSVDSIEYHDFCSYDCLKTHQDKYFKDARGSEEYEISRERVPEQQIKYYNEK